MGKWAVVVVALAMCASFAAGLKLSQEELGFPLDDSWIHLVFARNTAHGDFFAYNPHERVAGTTSPLWVLLLVPSYWSGVDPVVWAYALGVVFLVLGGLTVYRWLLSFTDEYAAMLGGLLYVSSGRMVWSALSGMEITLTAFLMIFTAYLAHRARHGGSKPVAAGIFAALATYARPEGYLFAFVLTGYLLFASDSDDPLDFSFAPKRALLFAVPYALVVSPYPILCYLNWGKPFPTTYYAKAGSMIGSFSFDYWLAVFKFFMIDNPIITPIAAAGIVYAISKARNKIIPAIVVLWAVAFLLVEGLMLPAVWHYARYTIPLWGFVLICGVAMLNFLAARWGWDKRSLRLRLPARGLSINLKVIVYLLIFVVGARDGIQWAYHFLWDVRGVNTINVEMGKFIAENVPKDETVLVEEVGALAYFGEHRTIDIYGLVDTRMTRFVIEHRGRLPMEFSRDVWEVIKCMPDVEYVACFPTWFPKLLERRYFQPVHATSYHLVTGLSARADRIMVRVLYRLDRSKLPPCELDHF